MTASRLVPFGAVRSTRAAVAAADQLATNAAAGTIAAGGTAVDGALAASAVMAVVAPHQCGLGGDLFAIVHTPTGDVRALNASGRAGSRADAAALRAEGHRTMPLRHDLRAVTVPGFVDGWTELHRSFGTRPVDELLAPAIGLAAGGFAASPLLAGALGLLDERGRAELHELAAQVRAPGDVVRRPGVAFTLQAIARGGRSAFYDGAFGEGLVGMPDSPFTDADLLTSQADWVDVVRTTAFGIELCTTPPNSQGYLTLAIAALADAVGLPEDPDDVVWAHVLIEAAKLASSDRPAVLHDAADGAELLAAAAARAAALDPDRASPRPTPGTSGDTTYLCTADSDGWAVSLIQSNAAGFGSWRVEPTTGINLHNRGLGFSLDAGHPAELGPGRRPPHTLSPAMALRDGRLAAVLGTMGGDAQPQIVAQLATRLFRHGHDVAAAVSAPRWILQGPSTGFDTWSAPERPTVVVEDGAPSGWLDGLTGRGHRVASMPAFDGTFGHAHAIVVGADGTFTSAADPRARVGAAAGL